MENKSNKGQSNSNWFLCSDCSKKIPEEDKITQTRFDVEWAQEEICCVCGNFTFTEAMLKPKQELDSSTHNY